MKIETVCAYCIKNVQLKKYFLFPWEEIKIVVAEPKAWELCEYCGKKPISKDIMFTVFFLDNREGIKKEGKE